MTAGTATCTRRLQALRDVHNPVAPPACSADPAASTAAANPELHGLTESERFFFELNGFLVIPGILSPKQLVELNQSVDHCTDHITPSAKLSGDVSALQGELQRGDTGEFMRWPEPWCQPFRSLLSHPKTVRIMLDLVGPGFHYSSANGILMDQGSEGITMHGGQRSDGAAGRRDAWTYTIDRNGQIECNLITVMYQLTDVGPDDGGTLVIPGSHKAFFNMPDDVRSLQANERFGADTGGTLVRPVPMKAGSALIFTEALSHGALPWTGAHQRRTLLYRYSSRGFSGGGGLADPKDYAPFRPELSPLGQAILEPAHLGNRPDILSLLKEEERAARDV